ncbi:Bgt-4496 [Blumeria graminis f. sp. tritici]|uniref:Uncharacterized protein n=2 Tax=Blumeria graminis f. sp. tritici TaxID=62690 RepID=A0A656KKE1_BLUGR|nr:hypothetical protein BGT96224_4496 [Blumeria graminis f. sp. tritici 96224]VCU38939.1 Bgt-4496 [Blumeria graminis f. sp. tritici]
MAPATKVPPPLQAYLAMPPESSLLLMTSVLGATSNWLVLRFLHQVLMQEYAATESTPAILFVSFLRDANFWMSGAKRIVSIPISACIFHGKSMGDGRLHSYPTT